MLENWREVPDGGGQYLVSDCGRVLSVGNTKNRKEKILKTYSYSKTGHQKVDLRLNGRVVKRSVHRLVAEAFLPNPFSHPVVNHKDNDPKNNSVNNLEWCTVEHNRQHYYTNFHYYKNPKFCHLNPEPEYNIQNTIDKLCDTLKISRKELKALL